MKRILSFTLALVFALTLFCSTAFADSINFSAKDIEIHKGETITVSFNVTAKSGIAAASFDLTYDAKTFTYVSHEYGNAFEGGMTVGNDLGDSESDGNGLFKYVFITADGTKNGGEMFNVSFKTNESVEVGKKFEFKLNCYECTDKDLNELEVNDVTVTATVVDGVAPSNTESKVTIETSATQDAESYLSSVAVSQSSNDNGVGGSGIDINLIIVIAVLVLIIIATVVAIILIVSKRKQGTNVDDDVMTKILADDADLDLLESDSLSEENNEIDVTDENDEVDE